MRKIIHESVGFFVADQSSQKRGTFFANVTELGEDGSRHARDVPVEQLLSKAEATEFRRLYEKLRDKAGK